MFASKDVFLTPPSGGGYNIARSVRLRSSATAYLNRTPSSSTNRRISTFSVWLKWSLTGSSVYPDILCAAPNGSTYRDALYFANNTLNVIFNGGVSYYLTTSQVFRDPAAWYHFVMAIDTTQATASNRVKLYVNGVQITAFSSANYPTQNYDPNFNSAIIHNIGRSTDANDYIDGYLTEINFIDGQALTPSSFGSTNTTTGVWQPAKYTGTYGTNGFYLNFSDNSGATATTIGKDYSGNGNNWTPNNISVTTGATYDSMLDVPTMYADGGNGRGNYATLNPLQCHPYVTLSSGNLTLAGNNAAGSGISLATQSFSSGLYYWEYIQAGTASEYMGVMTYPITGQNLQGTALETSYGIGARYNGNVYGIAGEVQTPAAFSWTTGDVIGIAVDANNGAVYYSKNGTWLNSGVPTSGASRTGSFFNYTPSSLRIITPFLESYTGGGASINFGQRPFAYTPPTGFKALNTQNLPTPTISNGASYMAATTYTGTGSALTIANTVGSASFQPDFVWVKGRSGATDHAWYDAVRGVQKQIESNTTTAETTETTGLTAFGSTGFTVGALAQMNTNAATYVGWQWKEGATQGFDIVTYTGTGSNLAVNHSLGVTPAMYIIKSRNLSSNWIVYHKDIGNNILYLNLTNGQTANSNFYYSNPNSTQFFNSTSGDVNSNGGTYVAYLFAAVAGYSAFGSYTGNGSADGPFVFTNFRPRFILVKDASTAQNWQIIDTSRDPYNVAPDILQPNLSNAESAFGSGGFDILSNGFKIRTSSASINTSGSTMIYAAFAESPFRNSLAR